MELPEEFKLGFSGSPGGKDWCQYLTNILSEALSPVDNLQDLIRQEISNLEDSLEKIISDIELQIKNQTEDIKNDELKESLSELRRDIVEGIEKAIDKLDSQAQEASQKSETPSAEIDISGPKPIQKKSQLSTDFAPPGNLSFHFQCNTPDANNSIDVGAETRWYFKILAWLMETCTSLPGMTNRLGLTERAADCYNPDQVTQTINQECNSLWEEYCDEDYEDSSQKSLPQICRRIRYSCRFNHEMAAALRCQELFAEEKETIPSSCTFQIIEDRVVYSPKKKNMKIRPRPVVFCPCSPTNNPFHQKLFRLMVLPIVRAKGYYSFLLVLEEELI